MIFKHIKISGIVLLCCLPLLFWGLKVNNDKIMLLSKGNYFFEKTRNSPNISSIILKFSNGKTISINKKNELWRIKEADDYYASFAKINSLVLLIRNTIIYRADAIRKNDKLLENNKQVTIQSVDEKGNIVDEAIIFEKQPNNKNHYATLNNDNFLYQVNGNFDISSNPMEWVQMPILKIANKEIKEIRCDKFSVYRQLTDDRFVDKETNNSVNHIDSFINSLWYLSSNKVFHSVNFRQDLYKKLRQYKIELFNGIIYSVVFYQNNENKDKYVVNIELEKNLLMSKDGIKWLEENSMLYRGWFFEISPDIGEILATFSI